MAESKIRMAKADSILVARLREDMASKGRNALGQMRREGIFIIEVIKAVHLAFGITLGDAKKMVTGHPSWVDVARRAEPLHELALHALEQALADYPQCG